MRTKITGVALAALIVLGACAKQVHEEAAREKAPAGPPNVVLIVGDGFGFGAWTIARECAKRSGETLALDDAEAVGFLDAACLGELVTDSAAAATAWSYGKLAPRRQIGFPESDEPNLFQRLRAADRAFGFVTTARVTHATPAPFYARADHRSQEDDVAPQLVAAPPDVAIGGGARHFLPKGQGGRRRDGRDLLAEAREAGMKVLTEPVAVLPLGAPVLAVLADSHLPHELDRAPGEPELADLAVAAVRRLRDTGRPWFLMVEAARIDHAGHDHDGPSIAANSLRLDRTVKAVLSETDRSRTLVIAASDHDTGNPTLLEFAHPESLDVVTASIDAMEERIFGGKAWAGTPAALRDAALPVIDEGARHTGLTNEDLDRLIRAIDRHQRKTALGTAVSRRFGISFLDFEDHLRSDVLHGHTGDLVPAAAWGPRAGEIAGIRDHAALGRWMADVLELDDPDPAASADSASIDSAGIGG